MECTYLGHVVGKGVVHAGGALKGSSCDEFPDPEYEDAGARISGSNRLLPSVHSELRCYGRNTDRSDEEISLCTGAMVGAVQSCV